MEFINQTDCPAELFRSACDNDVMYNSLLARLRYRIENNSELVPLTGNHEGALQDIRREQSEDEYGVIEPDMFFWRTGTDVIILGHAVSADGPVESMQVHVIVGPYNRKFTVFGDRVWKKTQSDNALKPSVPIPFLRMPITYKNAYGGTIKTEYGELAYYQNPIGKGYYLKEGDAVDNPLPNIEDPNNLIKKWDDNPEPVGFAPYPFNWGLRLMNVVEVDQKNERVYLRPENGMFDRAHPFFSGKQIEAGQQIALSGFSTNGEIIKLTIPECPLVAEIILEGDIFKRKLRLEEILIDLNTAIIDLTYRKLFDYKFIANQTRQTFLSYKT